MPELGEVAHAASLLKRFLLGKTIKSITANEDNLLYVAPLTNVTFQNTLTSQKVTDVSRHGKYFWLEFQDANANGNSKSKSNSKSSKYLLLHFGMTGWIHIKGIKTHFIVMENGGDKKAKERNQKLQETGNSEIEIVTDPDMEWPPRFTKFVLVADDDTEVAFTDPRRLGRVRLLEASDTDGLMSQEPLVRNGLDFSKNNDKRWDLDTFHKQVSIRKVPVKSLLMDQALFAGIGNWVADEILYQARIHPQQYSNTLTNGQLATLYEKLIDVCEFVVKVEGNTAAFPDTWLMLHRWGKRRKGEKQTVKEGYVVEHVTVGGRTSSYVKELQKLPGKTSKTSKTAATKASSGSSRSPTKKEKEKSKDGGSGHSRKKVKAEHVKAEA